MKNYSIDTYLFVSGFIFFSRKNMAESKERIIFQYQKELFEKMASKLTCNFCKNVPREGPIFQNAEGVTACSICKKSNLPTGYFHQVFGIEEMFQNLPVSCRFRKNDCRVIQNRKNIEYHEEDCEYRDVTCIYNYCKEICPAVKLIDHVKNYHNLDLFAQNKNVYNNGSKIIAKISIKYRIQFQRGDWGIFNESEDFVKAEIKKTGLHWDFEIRKMLGKKLRVAEIPETGKKKNLLGIRHPSFTNQLFHFSKDCLRKTDFRQTLNFKLNDKMFFIQFKVDEIRKMTIIWIQILGSKFEAKNYNYRIQMEDSEYGSFKFEGPVRSIDDDKTMIFEDQIGFSASTKVMKKHVQDELLIVEIKMEDLKSQEKTDQNSYVSNDEDD